MRRLFILTCVALALGGCTVGPNYVRPAVDTPPAWRMTDAQAKDVANTAWWGQFNDPVLDNLIGTALRENLDLQIASARVDEFAGRYGFVRADLFPFQDLRLFVEKDGRLRLTDDGAPVKYAASSDWGAIKPIITGLLRGD